MLIRALLAIVLFAHGVGHLLFVANSWGYWRGGEAGRSWPRLRCRLLGVLYPGGVVAAAGAGLRGDLFSDDRPLVGRHQYLERLFRPCGRHRRHRGRASATMLGGSVRQKSGRRGM
jgi:hypothetical protein